MYKKRNTIWLCLLVGLLVLASTCTRPTRDIDPATRSLMWEVQAALEDQQYSQALVVIDSALEREPEWAQLYKLRGKVLSSLYRFDDAESAYKRALQFEPDLQGVAYAMGNNAFFRGGYRKALAYYKAEREHVSRADTVALSAIWAQMGRVYARLGVQDSAHKAYSIALEYRPSYGQAWAWMAELYEDEGALEEARDHSERAVMLSTEDPEFNYLAGTLNYRTGRLQHVETYLAKVLAVEPWHVGANYNMARYLLALDRKEEAAAYLETTDRMQVLQADIVLARFAVERNPTRLEGWLILADLYGQAGRFREEHEALLIAQQLNQEF